MKISTDDVGINVTWHPSEARKFAVRVTALVSLGAIVIAALDIAAGHWATGTVVLVISTVALLFTLGQSRYGTLTLVEWPGFLLILLAGKRRRRHGQAILAHRRRAMGQNPQARTAAEAVRAELDRQMDGIVEDAERLRPSLRLGPLPRSWDEQKFADDLGRALRGR